MSARGPIAALGALLACVSLPDPSRADSGEPVLTVDSRASDATTERPGSPASAGSAAAPAPADALAIDLPTTLALAGAESLEVELARLRTHEARAVHERTRARYFPWIEPFAGYRRHEGRLQDIVGRILDTDRQAYDVGAAVVAEVDLGRVLYENLAAKQRARAAEHASESQRRESVALAASRYLELARTEASVEVAAESVRIARDYADQLERAVAIGIAFQGDLHRARARVERNLRLASQVGVERRVAAARLAEALALDPAADLRIAAPELGIWALVDPEADQEALVRDALARRPELRAVASAERAAAAEHDAARVGPWLPTIGGRASVYGLGGGVGDARGRFGDGQDYGVGLRWRLGPGGLFDAGREREMAARAQQAGIERRRLAETVTREVVEAHTRARALAEQRAMAERMLEASEETLRLSRERKAFGVGSVLETLAAEEDLTRARLEYVGLVSEANRAQLELQRAIGDEPGKTSGSDVIPRS